MLQVFSKVFQKYGGVLIAVGLLLFFFRESKPSGRAITEWFSLTFSIEAVASVIMVSGMVAFGTGFALQNCRESREKFASKHALGRMNASHARASATIQETTVVQGKKSTKQNARESAAATAAHVPPGREILGKIFGRDQERFTMRISFEQRKGQSWLGGLPKMPPHMEWPTFNGVPGSFLAQIGLYDLPDMLWQGAGPQEGWLLFWGNPDCSGDVAVRYVTHEEMEERAQPEGVVHGWHWNMQPEGLKAAFGAAGPVPPKWYLEPVDAGGLGAVEDIERGEGFWDSEKGNYVWEPSWPLERGTVMNKLMQRADVWNGVDWPSVLGLMEVWRTSVKGAYAGLKYSQDHRAESEASIKVNHEAQLAKLMAKAGVEEQEIETLKARHLQHLATWSAARDRDAETFGEFGRIHDEIDLFFDEVLKLSKEAPFAPEVGEEIFKGLTSIYDANRAQFGRDRGEFLENYARYMYMQNPEDESALVAFFKPLWQLQAKECLIFMGLNQEGRYGAQSPARLIDLPSNPLAGIGFGDESRFFVEMPLEAFVQSEWEKAYASDTHGM